MSSAKNNKKYDVILVAGEGKSSYKVYHQNKAFLTLQGKCVILYVIETLQQVESIGDIYIVGLKDQLDQVLHSSRIDREYPKRIHVVEQKANLYENVWQTFLQSQQVKPEDTDTAAHRDKAVLIVPCDAPLITPHEVEYFIANADMDNYDHVLGLVSREKLRHFYPQENKAGIKMAYLHIKEDSFRINNLHLVKPLRIENREYIQKMYQYRYQRNFKNLVLFGLSVFGKDKAKHYKNYLGLQLCLFFGGLGLEFVVDYFRKLNPKKELEESISNIMKTRFSALEVPYPGAALDIDNAKDYEAMKIQFDEWQKYLRTAPLTRIEKYSEAISPSRKVARTSH
ncbi:MAG: NTP transferase domain-containing protein [Nitrospina sp.]|jgi:GTP:adenosylcobinamide-phosphate guanylyltransferase|nr:NTP transferase domain-containing protein [Nitrospina sp.]MBT6718616.1 NTP transferase domain-containing protein [Nitrospina sp.]